MAKAELRLARADLLDTIGETPPHPDLVPLFNAVYEVTWRSSEIRLAYSEIERLRASGPPKPHEWPDSTEYRRWREELDSWTEKERAAAKDAEIIAPRDPEWTEAIREWRDAYPAWSNAIVAARREADSPRVVALMNGTESRPTKTWTGRLKIDLDRLGGTLHWTGAPGRDGLGVIRYRVPMPEGFGTRAKAIGDRLVEIRAVPMDSRPITPTPDSAGDGGLPALPAVDDQPASPALTENQSRVLQTMALFDASRLLSADAIAVEMVVSKRLSPRTIGPIVRKLIDLRLAERPEGDRSGARLTITGRRLASKIAD
jgi:hypothetical protein